MARTVWGSINWDPFTTGQMNSLKLNREHLKYGEEYEKAFRDMGDRVEQENVDTYLSSVPENQALAASMGQDRGQFWQNQQESVLRDPQFQRLLPQTQQKILSRVREGAQADIMNMFQRGELENARRTAETMGLVSPSNQYMEAIQAENPAAVDAAMQGMNQNWAGSLTSDGQLSLNGQNIPADVWLNYLATRQPNQAGAGSAASIAQQNLERQLAATGNQQQLIDDRRAQQEQASKLQLLTLQAQLSGLQQTPQVMAVQSAISQMLGTQPQQQQVPATSQFEVIDVTPQPQQLPMPTVPQSVPQSAPVTQQLDSLATAQMGQNELLARATRGDALAAETREALLPTLIEEESRRSGVPVWRIKLLRSISPLMYPVPGYDGRLRSQQ